jgi:hypothetical protein
VELWSSSSSSRFRGQAENLYIFPIVPAVTTRLAVSSSHGEMRLESRIAAGTPMQQRIDRVAAGD